jgi:UDP-N-acetylglucosamine--N-acetylmuramyl-(pentapeptide) pyrophosphoryl-undecaprenol N-acetylglucosamine transferase
MPYPVRENLTKYSKEDSCGYFELDSNKKILFVLGGSQGASSINRVILKNLDNLAIQNIQVIWQTGHKDYTEISEKVRKYSGIKPLVFIENIEYAYSAADLILCRSGISTVMELAYFGAAAIFIPYEYASENHQEKNARELVNANAAEIILDSHLESQFTDKVISLIKDENRLTELRTNIMKFAGKNAAAKIACLLIELSNRNLN